MRMLLLPRGPRQWVMFLGFYFLFVIVLPFLVIWLKGGK